MPEEQEQQETAFSADYVKQLREENASWRKKVRELEAQNTLSQVGMELTRRGIQADPAWVKLQDGQEIPEAIDVFIQTYPVFANGNGHVEQEEEPPTRRTAPPPMPAKARQANTPGPPAKGAFSGRDIPEIRKDPSARKALTDHYRTLLHGSQE